MPKPLYLPPRTDLVKLKQAVENYNLAFAEASTPEEAVHNFETYYPAVKKFVQANIANLLLDALQLHIVADPAVAKTLDLHKFEAVDPDSEETGRNSFCKVCGKHRTYHLHIKEDENYDNLLLQS